MARGQMLFRSREEKIYRAFTSDRPAWIVVANCKERNRGEADLRAEPPALGAGRSIGEDAAERCGAKRQNLRNLACAALVLQHFVQRAGQLSGTAVKFAGQQVVFLFEDVIFVGD